MDITLVQGSKIAIGVFRVLKSAYESRQQARVEEFLHFIDLRYDAMLPENKQKLNEHINSPQGQEVLAAYVDAILRAPSKRVRMAIAMLYCDDKDFVLDETDRHIFVSAMEGITDDIIDFFIKATELPETQGRSAYPRTCITKDTLDQFKSNRWSVEGVFIYVNDLIRRRLLLPDPVVQHIGGASGDEGWAVWYGSSSKSKKMAAILRKAGELIEESA